MILADAQARATKYHQQSGQPYAVWYRAEAREWCIRQGTSEQAPLEPGEWTCLYHIP